MSVSRIYPTYQLINDFLPFLSPPTQTKDPDLFIEEHFVSPLAAILPQLLSTYTSTLV